MARFVETRVDSRTMRILVGEPAGTGPHPAVLLAFHREGFSSFAHEVVARFAKAGYLIAAPDLYHRSDGASWEIAVKQRRDEHVLADMAAGLAWLKSRPDVDKDRVVIVGHCMGGRIAFLVAGSWPQEFAACLSYYGGGTFVPWGGTTVPFDLLRNIRCPVAGFFGNEDDNPSPADADRIDAELTRAGVPHEFHRFDGAGHGYMYREMPYFHEVSAEESWTRSFAFLRRLGIAPESHKASVA